MFLFFSKANERVLARNLHSTSFRRMDMRAQCAHTANLLLQFSLVFLEIQINFNRHDRTRVYWIFERVLIMHAVCVSLQNCISFFYSPPSLNYSWDFSWYGAHGMFLKSFSVFVLEIYRNRCKCKSRRFIKIQWKLFTNIGHLVIFAECILAEAQTEAHNLYHSNRMIFQSAMHKV